MSSSNDELRDSERKAWMVAFCVIGFLSGMFVQQFATMITQAPLLAKIPNAPSNGDTNTTITTTPLTTTPDYPTDPVTHFAFYDNGVNGGKGYYGIYKPNDGNIWYFRWHTVAIQETGLKDGKLLVNYCFYDTSGSLFSDSEILEFYKGEIKQDLEFMIQITEDMARADPDLINYSTVKIELVGET